MAYTGPIYRGIDYNPTWPGWAQGPGEKDVNARLQTFDSDMANDAFASLWGKRYQTAPAGDAPFSVPANNGANYRDDLGKIASDGFNLVRLYNWDVARGTSPSQQNKGLDHLNFLNYAKELGIKVVVPVSDFFLNDTEFSWKGVTPDSNYSFSSATTDIQNDFKQFIASITDPATGKIHSAVIISVGNEGDIGEDLQDSHTNASNFLARTNWWITNLNKQINGPAGAGPDGDPVINGPGGPIVQITATFANADQGAGGHGSWFRALLEGVQAGQLVPNPLGWYDKSTTFTANVKGLAAADPGFESYYFNSFNIGQSTSTAPFSNGITNTLTLLDSGASPWPGAKFNVPVLLMEVFTPNRFEFKPPATPADQAVAAINEVKDLEAYLAAHKGTTNLMGYNYFEFNDEPHANKQVGLYQNSSEFQNAQTGTSGIFYISRGGFADFTFPVYKLTSTPAPDGQTLAQAWTSHFAATHPGTATNDTLVGSAAAERLQGLAGNDTIDGGAGHDIAVYGQNAKNYTLKTTAGSAALAVQDSAAITIQDSAAVIAQGSAAITVQDKVGTEGTDTLTGIETVRFADQALPTSWLTATASLSATQILKVVDLYSAGLNRAPDALGLQYYGSQLADGVSLSDISKAIFGSAEAAPIYSSTNSNTVFVNLVYQTALGRAPDAAGAAYWLNELATGHIQRTDLVTSLIAGARGSGGSAADAAYIANKEAVGAHFALTQGLNNVTWARAVESGVNGTAASVTAANAQTDAFAATAATAAGTELVVQIVGLVP